VASSSRSKRRRAGMGGRLPVELAQAALRLGLDVERRLPARDAPRVARLDQRADLLAQARVGRCGGARERRQLLLDVERLLAARGAARVARLEHLADVLVALARAHRRGRPAPRREIPVLADREAAAPDLVVELAAGEQRVDGADDGEEDD